MIEPKLVSKMRPESSLGSCTMKVPRPSWATRRSLVSTARPLQPSWTWRGTTPLVLGASAVRIRIWAGRKLWRRHTYRGKNAQKRSGTSMTMRLCERQCQSLLGGLVKSFSGGSASRLTVHVSRYCLQCTCVGLYWGLNMGPSCSGRSSWTRFVRNGAHMSMDRGKRISWLLELAESATASWRASCMAGRAKLTVCLIS